MKELCEELDFVGSIKKIYWFNRDLMKNNWFIDLVEKVIERRPDTTLRNIFYSFFPITEYINYQYSVEINEFASFECWRNVVSQNESYFIHLVCQHGTQGNIPQRAAIILDFLTRRNFLGIKNTILEIGCSAGLVGSVFTNHRQLFSGDDWKKYFWLKKRPQIHPEADFCYIGCDLMPPPSELVPFFIWDKNKRAQVSMFLRDYPPGGGVVKKSALDFLGEESFKPPSGSGEKLIIITSFVLYQFDEPKEIQSLILDFVSDNIHWIDLSRNNNLPDLFVDQAGLRSNWIYLSHNGEQVAEVFDGSDDCPNWRYL